MKTKTKITKDTNIAEAMETNENVPKVLFEAGIGCLGCSMAHAETLYDGLMAHGLSEKEIDVLIDKMNK
jgi:hybrid cluster-associated redox disulfide protein